MSIMYLGGADGSPVAVTPTSSAHLIADDAYEGICTHLMVQNTGAAPCWIKTGQSDVVATQRSVMIPALWREVFRKAPGETHIAAICEAGQSTALVVTPMSAGS